MKFILFVCFNNVHSRALLFRIFKVIYNKKFCIYMYEYNNKMIIHLEMKKLISLFAIASN